MKLTRISKMVPKVIPFAWVTIKVRQFGHQVINAQIFKKPIIPCKYSSMAILSCVKATIILSLRSGEKWRFFLRYPSIAVGFSRDLPDSQHHSRSMWQERDCRWIFLALLVRWRGSRIAPHFRADLYPIPVRRGRESKNGSSIGSGLLTPWSESHN